MIYPTREWLTVEETLRALAALTLLGCEVTVKVNTATVDVPGRFVRMTPYAKVSVSDSYLSWENVQRIAAAIVEAGFYPSFSASSGYDDDGIIQVSMGSHVANLGLNLPLDVAERS